MGDGQYGIAGVPRPAADGAQSAQGAGCPRNVVRASIASAREMADWFRQHDLAMMDALVPHFSNNAKMLSEAAAGREELRQVFARDRETEKRSAGRKE